MHTRSIQTDSDVCAIERRTPGRPESKPLHRHTKYTHAQPLRVSFNFVVVHLCIALCTPRFERRTTSCCSGSPIAGMMLEYENISYAKCVCMFEIYMNMYTYNVLFRSCRRDTTRHILSHCCWSYVF